MDRYTIYCTAMQTKKAFILHAPIEHWGNTSNLMTPTAEQMIGWLEEHHIDCFVGKQLNHRFVATVCVNEALIFSKPCNLRKEATLTAIDAALDYLIKNKK